MDLTGKEFSLTKLRELDLVSLLEKLEYLPVSRKKNDTDWWYLSPLRNECTASFHVDRLSNQWYDFGLMAGGNPVDFCLRYYDCGIADLPDKLGHSFSPHRLAVFEPRSHDEHVRERHSLAVKSVRSLYAYPLKNYLHERSIPIGIADAFCKEVIYDIGGRLYYGIGFQNDMGGWEIRNKNFKQSCSPKDITCLAYGARSVHVFEGFMDFLSYRTLHPKVELRSADYVVLNGAGLFDHALPFLERHERVHLWLDRDVTGLAYRDYAMSRSSRFVDESGLYEKFKDLNEWLCYKGEAPKQRLSVGTGVRFSG